MTELAERCDCLVSTLLKSLAVLIISRVAEKTKLDPEILDSRIPGLKHTHWYIASDYVDGCGYCQRMRRLEEARKG